MVLAIQTALLLPFLEISVTLSIGERMLARFGQLFWKSAKDAWMIGQLFAFVVCFCWFIFFGGWLLAWLVGGSGTMPL